jgi:hypothetical protein
LSSDERTGFRDLTLSKRHRKYGINVPFTDVDCLRYNRGVPVALEEWKYGGPQGVSRKAALAMLNPGHNPNITASLNLAAAAGLPYFLTRHFGESTGAAGTWEFDVIPGNDKARAIIHEPTLMDERTYIAFIHQLGGHVPDRGVERWLDRHGPSQA